MVGLFLVNSIAVNDITGSRHKLAKTRNKDLSKIKKERFIAFFCMGKKEAITHRG